MRIFSIRLFILFATLVFCLKLPATEQPFIEVISSDLFPITGIKSLQRQGYLVNVYNLDDGKRLVAQIGANLPNNQNAAKNVLQQRFKKMGDKQVKAQFIQAYQAVTLSTQYGLSRYPVVVFNHGESVIYGETNLAQALSLYQQWKAK